MLKLDKNQRYLLACSYGPDSMALFSMLKNEGYYFEVGHVNYHLRDESTLEQENLKAYCAQNHVNFHGFEVVAHFGKANLEKACRDIRYNFLMQVLKDRELDAILVGHHQDDLIETYLMQIRRRNLVLHFGIKEKTMMSDALVIRPLLTFSKRDLLSYCDDHQVPFAIDKSNLTDRYLRNQIRHHVVEKLTREQREIYLKEIEDKNNSIAAIFAKINSEKYETNNEILRLDDVEFLYALVLKGRALKNDFKLSKKQGMELRKILASKKANVTLLIDGLSFQKHYDTFSFSLPENDHNFNYILERPGQLDTPYFCLDFTGDTSNRNVGSIDYPLTIRNARPSDQYGIKEYSKTLRRLFIDWKMPNNLRKRWPVIVNREGRIIYVPRYKNDFVSDLKLNFYVKI